jgi:uncharacterized protein YciI
VKRYLVVSIRRPDFDASVIAPHLAFLDGLRAAGQLELSGGFADKSGGAYLLANIDSLEQARALVARDPLAVADASELTVYEWEAG